MPKLTPIQIKGIQDSSSFFLFSPPVQVAMTSGLGLYCTLLGALLLSGVIGCHGDSENAIPFQVKTPFGGSWRGAPLPGFESVVAWTGIEYVLFPIQIDPLKRSKRSLTVDFGP
jgi:hypothetical protein